MEFALILPLLLILIFGMLTGGIVLNRGLSLSHAAREASRYGATLPRTDPMSGWLNAVADRAESASAGELDPAIPDRYVCVAFVSDATDNLERGDDRVNDGDPCFADGRPADEARVQVVVERAGEIMGVFFTVPLTLDSEAASRYELDPGS